jgi:hypothetical protein
MRGHVLVAALVAVVLCAGCTSDSRHSAASESATRLPASTAGTTPTASNSSSTPSSPAAPVSSTAARPRECTQQGTYKISIANGPLACADAYAIAAQVNTQGASRQRIAGYTCEFGNATTRPTIFTCSTGEMLFSVAEAVGPQQCNPVDKYRIKITRGRLTCTEAYEVAFKVNTQGDSVQHVNDFTCQFGNAQTRPTVFTCVSSDAEFSVDEK